MGNPTKDDMGQLRGLFDGSEPFMTGRGISVHGKAGSGHDERMRRVPAWTRNDKMVNVVLTRAFPYMSTNEAQTKRAGRWAFIIYTYFRVGWTAGRIAADLSAHKIGESAPKVSEKQVEDTIRRIKRVAAGLRTTGKSRTGRIGRPKR
jgi:hypothetical protein